MIREKLEEKQGVEWIWSGSRRWERKREREREREGERGGGGGGGGGGGDLERLIE